MVGHLADQLQAEAADALGPIPVGPDGADVADVLHGKADALVFDDDRNSVRVVFQDEQEPAVARGLGMAHDVGAKLAYDELDVGDVLVYDAQVFQQRVPDAPGDPQICPIAGQVQRHFEVSCHPLPGRPAAAPQQGVPGIR